MRVKIINKSNNPLPDYATSYSAGMDLRANLTESITLKPLERALIATGLFIELPAWLRSSDKTKKWLGC